MNANTYMQAILWCCTSCGFLKMDHQPHMECPFCEASKAAFINTPQHIEAALREQFQDMTNSAEARQKRLELLKEGGFLKGYRVRGRAIKAVHMPKASRQTI